MHWASRWKRGIGDSGYILVAVLMSAALFAGCTDDEPIGTPPPPPDPADTTSHSYIWHTDTLGGILSVVNDVYCFSETDAWAVGYFYFVDSSGQEDRKRNANAAHWDGRNWTLARISPPFQGKPSFAEAQSVFRIAHDDIWVDSRHWNGLNWQGYYLTPIGRAGGTYKIWGDRSDNIYFVGDRGSIIHWNGSTHTQMGPDEPTAWLRDAWGWDGTIYVAVTNTDQWSFPRGHLIRIEQGRITGTEDPDHGSQVSVWGMNGTWYAGGSAYLNRKINGVWERVLNPDHWITGVRGTALNDVCLSTEQGEVIHYNGSTFATVLDDVSYGFFTNRSAIAVVGSMVLACGHFNNYAVVRRGYRQPVR